MRVAELEPSVELISADSMQVYRGMDIGTAKPTPTEQASVAHHLIDIVEPNEDYTVSEFIEAAEAAAASIRARGRVPVLVGGTGLYVRAVIDDFEIPGQYAQVRAELDANLDTRDLFQRLEELDPVASSRMEPTNRRRIVRALEVTLGSGRRFSDWGPGMNAYPPIATRQIACDRPRPVLDERIAARYRAQIEAGFVEEVRGLLDRPGAMSRTARQALGYKELIAHIEAGRPLVMQLDIANQRTRRFARRQQRWFRRDPRVEWHDLEATDSETLAADLANFLASS